MYKNVDLDFFFTPLMEVVVNTLQQRFLELSFIKPNLQNACTLSQCPCFILNSNYVWNLDLRMIVSWFEYSTLGINYYYSSISDTFDINEWLRNPSKRLIRIEMKKTKRRERTTSSDKGEKERTFNVKNHPEKIFDAANFETHKTHRIWGWMRHCGGLEEVCGKT